MTTQILKPKKKPARERGSNGRGNSARTADIVINGDVHIPTWVTSHDSFRRWACSDDFPQRGQFSWLAGKLHVQVHSELLNHLSDAAIEGMRAKACEPIRRSRSSAANARPNEAHAGGILIDELVRIPWWVRDHDSFRRWAFSDGFPERGQFAFLSGTVWADLSMETDCHNQIKTVITIVIGSIVLNEALGRFYADKMLLTNPAIGLSNEPDAMFVSNARLEKGLGVLKEGDKSTELSGAADMALEVVSNSSVEKDKVDLMNLYAKAGIAEYWLVDSTIESPELVIMRLVAGKYVTGRRRDGWVKSKVFGRSFRLTCRKDAKGVSHFNLETK
jgi:Uma2 family endonuclease